MIKWNRTKGREGKYNKGLFDQPGFLAQVHTYKLRAFPGRKNQLWINRSRLKPVYVVELLGIQPQTVSTASSRLLLGEAIPSEPFGGGTIRCGASQQQTAAAVSSSLTSASSRPQRLRLRHLNPNRHFVLSYPWSTICLLRATLVEPIL